MKTNEEIADRLSQLLENSAIKRGSKQARLVEGGLLMGMMFADPAYQTPSLQILMISGRSILQDRNPQ
jgi:hypothetical protein